MIFDTFVIPFMLGLTIMCFVFVWQFYRWYKLLNKEEKARIRAGIFSRKIFSALKEILLEGLLHKRIFKVNPVLGYMHMSLAFGWFMLIAIGNLESRIHSGTEINPPYFPIFFKFFVHERSSIPFNQFFEFIMDFFLLIVLSGLFLAIFKRINSRIFGMKRVFQRKILDKVALSALWFVFPLRFLAESFTASTHHTGSFLTGGFGALFVDFSNIENVAYVCWWAYSSALCLFFISLPFSRYMHIPAEVLLIALRHFGIKSEIKYSALSSAEVYSCSRCGICLDSCQLNTAARIRNIQPAHFIRGLREKTLSQEITQNCLLCHRCREFCPVNIETSNLLLYQRSKIAPDYPKPFTYITFEKIEEKATVGYFAGCMTHLTPTIKTAMLQIFKKAGEKVVFLDERDGICCGRPQILAGKMQSAQRLIQLNTEKIQQLGIKKLILSCPICYNVFRKEYKLDIEIQHHTKYIHELIQSEKIKLQSSPKTVVYHDPCELGRENGEYDAPRQILEKTNKLISVANEKEKALCCGGSLGNTFLTNGKKNSIKNRVLDELLVKNTEMLVTACPLCKKTLAPASPAPVKDIAEIVANSITN